MSPITLYSWPTPNGIKASITLEELGIQYKTEAVNISTNIQKEEYVSIFPCMAPHEDKLTVPNRWFLKINPNGRIPALLDGDQRVFESGAIMLYLTEKYDAERKISYTPGSAEYVEELCWLMFQMGGLGPMMGKFIIKPYCSGQSGLTTLWEHHFYTGQAEHFRIFASTRSDYAIKRYIHETKRLYSVLDSRLKKSPYLAGSKYTIADIANYSWVQVGQVALEIDLAEWPALKNWSEKIKGGEAVKRGIVTPKTGTTAEQMAERFKAARTQIDGLVNTDLH
jgi:glutathione S-transferase